jgi:signal transduction histidine kinase
VSVAGILEDDGPPTEGGLGEQDGANLWISTSSGLYRYDPKTDTARHYDVKDGLPGDNFSLHSAFKSASGKLFFGSTNGLAAFYPAQIQDNPHIPPVVLTDFQLANKPVEIGDESVLQAAIPEAEHLTLSHQDRVISFEFAALDYRSPNKNRYRYTLEGFDEDWTEVGSDRRFVTYTNLDPGEYTFRVLGSNSDGVWNEEGTSLGLTITPPWWGTTWFRGLFLVVVIAGVYGAYRWRVGSLETQRRELETQVGEKTHELSERVKELDCLHGISGLAGTQGISLEEILGGAVGLIPPAWRYPEIAGARVVLEGQEYTETAWRQSASIRIHGEQVGSVEVCYLEERAERDEGPFLKDERSLLDAVAERLGRIVERLRAEQDLRRTSDELATLLAVSQDVTSTLDLEPLLNLTLDHLKQVVDYDVATIRRLVQGNMELQAHRWLFPQEGRPSQHLPVATIPIIREMVQTRQAILVADHQFNPRIVGDTELLNGILTGEVLQASRTLMCVPLVVKGEVIGMLVLGHHQPNCWREEEKELVQAFANQAAVAIANAELYEKASKTATLEERTRLARELHDSATQALYSATLFSEAGRVLAQAGDLESAQHYLSRVGDAVHQALKDMRVLIFQLRPPVLEKEGLVGALEQRLNAVEKRAGIRARLITDEVSPLSDSVTDGLYHIALAALNNALKHAEADAVTVTIRSDGETMTLEVVDDGHGFDPQAVQDGGGMGLVSMRERAAKLGADLVIDSAPGEGTRVRVSVGTRGSS